MKIELEVPDITKLTTVLNNAVIAYGKIISAAQFQCEVPKGFEFLRDMSDYELMERFKCLKDFYVQICDIEKEVKQND